MWNITITKSPNTKLRKSLVLLSLFWKLEFLATCRAYNYCPQYGTQAIAYKVISISACQSYSFLTLNSILQNISAICQMHLLLDCITLLFSNCGYPLPHSIANHHHLKFLHHKISALGIGCQQMHCTSPPVVSCSMPNSMHGYYIKI